MKKPTGIRKYFAWLNPVFWAKFWMISFIHSLIYYCRHRLGPLNEKKRASISGLACDLPISLLCCLSHNLLQIFLKVAPKFLKSCLKLLDISKKLLKSCLLSKIKMTATFCLLLLWCVMLCQLPLVKFNNVI